MKDNSKYRSVCTYMYTCMLLDMTAAERERIRRPCIYSLAIGRKGRAYVVTSPPLTVCIYLAPRISGTISGRIAIFSVNSGERLGLAVSQAEHPKSFYVIKI